MSIIQNKEIATNRGVIRCHHTDTYANRPDAGNQDLNATRLGLEQSNSAVKFDDKFLMSKLIRVPGGTLIDA